MSKIYVPDQVSLVCTDGMKKNAIQVKSQTTIKIAGGKLAATINDRFEGNFFCAKMVIAGAIIGAIAAAIFVAATILTGGALGFAAAAAIGAGAAAGGAAVGAAVSLMPSICSMLTSGSKWVPVHPQVQLQKQFALIESSKIPCFLGGNVMIFYSEKAAEEFTDLKVWQTATNVGGIILGSALLSGAVAAVSTAATVFGTNVKMVYTVFGGKAAAIYTGGATTLVGIGYGASKAFDAVKGAAYDAVGVGGYARNEVLTESQTVTQSTKPIVDVDIPAAGSSADPYADASGIIVDENGNQRYKPNVSNYEQYDYERRTGIHTNDGYTREEYQSDRQSTANPNAVRERNPTVENANSRVYEVDRSGAYYSTDNVRLETGRQLDLRMSATDMKANGIAIGKNAIPSPLEWAIDAYNIVSNKLLTIPLKDYKDSLADEAAARSAIKVLEKNI
jgi:hypothetical protein